MQSQLPLRLPHYLISYRPADCRVFFVIAARIIFAAADYIIVTTNRPPINNMAAIRTRKAFALREPGGFNKCGHTGFASFFGKLDIQSSNFIL
jgi:hypothetical protein